MSILCIYDTEVLNPLMARMRDIDYDYLGEQWVQDTAGEPQTQNPKRWGVRWELTDEEDGTVQAIWTRPDGDPSIPSLTYKHPSFTGEWVLTPHRVYVAGTRHTPDTLTVVNALRDAGVTVTSTWHDNPPGDTAGTHEARRATAMANYAAIDRATLVVAVPCPTHHLRGAHTEVGYAVGKDMPVVVVGASGDLNTMTEHPNVTYTTMANLVLDIARRAHTRKGDPTP